MYQSFISPSLSNHILKTALPVPGVPELLRSPLESTPPEASLESPEALLFLVELYTQIEPTLRRILKQRELDRNFIDERTNACFEFNQRFNIDWLDKNYQSVIGLQDSSGRTVIGPLSEDYCQPGGKPVAPIPDYLKGPHVTLFGPPDSAKMAINAMNAFHRKLPQEPAIIERLLKLHPSLPKWGADDEDSKTPLHSDLIDAGINLTACFEGNLKLTENDKQYQLCDSNRAIPIKRFPGLALPCTFLFYKGEPIPLHLYDFALHFYRNWRNPQALSFYVPKLENEEEAQYIKTMIQTAETLLQQRFTEYKRESIRLMIVLENPRAILRTHEIMDALHPYFVGASLGWHDYLASTARLFKNDANYRIPVKADPNIVIKYIKASHSLLADVVGSRGGIKVGGMYGILPLQNDLHSASFQLTLKGFFKDVITQFKRDLTGYWVAHPDFVRIGLALVSAWKEHTRGNEAPLQELTTSLLLEPHADEILRFIKSSDIQGLDKKDTKYVRSLLVADIKESDFIANNHPDEIRYNVFQCLQYLTDWLTGNGCVALPAMLNDVPVRVMDDLATTERSRWEVWHEIRHGRFSVDQFIKICHEEMNFIRRDQSNDKKIVQVKWNERTQKWYPVALKIMLKLMTDSNPCEFATELLLPFTLQEVRNSEHPWSMIQKIDAEKFQLEPYVNRFDYYFEICGSLRFASEMAKNPIFDRDAAQKIILSFSQNEIIESASFHGNIGESKATLDAQASKEQALVFQEAESLKNELKSLGAKYLEKFGFKFLVSAKGKSGKEMLEILKDRITKSKDQEVQNAQKALWEISEKRFTEHPIDFIMGNIEQFKKKYGINSVAIAVTDGKKIQSLNLNCPPETHFELASLSKTLGSCFALEYFHNKGIPLDTSVNQLLQAGKSFLQLSSPKNSEWGDRVTLRHLLNHSALNMHYVNGFPTTEKMPTTQDILKNPTTYNYPAIEVINEPGTKFSYSGGGFLVLEHLIECLEKKPLQEITNTFFKDLGLLNLTFQQSSKQHKAYATGYFEDGSPVSGGRLMFPAIAAGSMGTAHDTLSFLKQLGDAYKDSARKAPIAHETAMQMLHGVDLGSQTFMGCKMGLGVFIAEAGENKLAIHQGANEGFRAIFAYCFSGPERGKGFVIFCNANNPGVPFIAETAQLLLKYLNFSGINYSHFQSQQFDYSRLSQEQIVNLGYKALLFDAFLPTLPQKITYPSKAHELSKFNLVNDATVVACSNQRFARAENLISNLEPIFDPDHFGSQGKIMDSWESARHNPKAYDHLILQLKQPSGFGFVHFSTKYHDGNQAEFVSLLGRKNPQDSWQVIIPKTPMLGHSFKNIALDGQVGPYAELKVEMYPDGGLTRIGIYADLPAEHRNNFHPMDIAKPLRFSDPIPKGKKPLTIPFNHLVANPDVKISEQRIDWACALNGGKILAAGNEHYSPAIQLISPYPPLHMFDGLENARSRQPGHFEEVIIQLGKSIQIEELVFNFKFFVNNNPQALQVYVPKANTWIAITETISTKAFAGNQLVIKPKELEKYDRIKVRLIPDGGINRLHVYGN